MNQPWENMPVPGASSEAEKAIGVAIQDLAAARMGRAFVPLAVVFVVGIIRLVMGADSGLWAAGGALLTGVATLAFGLRISQLAFGRPSRLWMVLARIGGLIPLSFGPYLFGWLGLRAVAAGGGWIEVATGVLFTVLGFWTMRSWMRVVELERLAETMTSAAGLDFDR